MFGSANLASKKCIFTYNYYEIATLYPSHQHQLPVFDLDPSCELLVACYNSFDCHQYFLKFSPQLIENLEMLVIKGECSAILAECGCWIIQV